MAKRAREGSDDGEERISKRSKPWSVDRLSSLSDELLLKVLSYLPISQLVVVGRLSLKYQKLAGDGQIWKAHYYDRFVRPRASRLPGFKEAEVSAESLHSASKASRWLRDDHLIKSGGRTNWKRQYRLRHNWARGTAAISEIPVAERAAIPPTLVSMHNGVVYTADHTEGLRAWSAKGTRQMIAHLPFSTSQKIRSPPPTAIGIDCSAEEKTSTRIMVGFEDGSYSVFALQHTNKSFGHVFTHAASSSGVITSVSLSWPYAVTMTATQLLSLYRFEVGLLGGSEDVLRHPPRLLHSLKSHTVWPPLSTSLRTSASAIFVCVAYALPTYLSGWTVGLQELKITPEGKFLDSRLASAIDQHYRPLAFSTRPVLHHLPFTVTGPSTSTALELRHIHSKPTSLSYTHPYLLVSHPDNTLTLYLVNSTAESLSISAGSRLWGHTSSVSGAHVSGQGRAVSVSRRGDELRVWELEGGFASTAARKRLASGALSVQIRPDDSQRDDRVREKPSIGHFGKALSARGRSGLRCTVECEGEQSPELTLSRGWIGFDDENVVVLREHNQGNQALIVYDFT